MKKPKHKKKKRTDHSSLTQHKRQGKTLTPPFLGIGNINLQSWINERLPDMLWAALLTRLKPREQYLDLFRRISDGAEGLKDSDAFVTHTALAKVSDSEFDLIFAPIVGDAAANAALAPLALLETLPDRKHWLRLFPTAPSDKAWSELAEAILLTLPHQSEAATDIRWLKVRFIILQGRLKAVESVRERIEEILAFPSKGDLRSVRPSIRSMEGAVGGIVPVDRSWCDAFWQECFQKTPCSAIFEPGIPSAFPYDDANKIWGRIYTDLAKHSNVTISTTAIDARHDGAFGLALYGMVLVASVFRPNATRLAGRIILRSLVETYLTLAYLVKKNDPKLWTAYRTYGGGQAKLAFLKLVEADELPQYVDLEALEQLANEDVWQELLEIDLGHWANKDLRRISEEVGVKDTYDKFYGWPSAFVHGQWGAVRSTVFAQCLNPLHRLHRVPRIPRSDFEDVSWDAVKLGNMLLQLLDQAYPGFAPRFRLEEVATPKSQEDKQAP